MKNKMIALSLFLASVLTVNAQQERVSKQLYTSAYKIATDSKEDVNVRKAASFKVDAMAYYMHEYVNLFTKEYARADKQKRKEQVLKIFRNASINHPLYNDPDKSLVLVYFNSEDYLTQFSLDTDWIAALAEVKKKLAE